MTDLTNKIRGRFLELASVRCLFDTDVHNVVHSEQVWCWTQTFYVRCSSVNQQLFKRCSSRVVIHASYSWEFSDDLSRFILIHYRYRSTIYNIHHTGLKFVHTSLLVVQWGGIVRRHLALKRHWLQMSPLVKRPEALMAWRIAYWCWSPLGHARNRLEYKRVQSQRWGCDVMSSESNWWSSSGAVT